jgi:hypothetical protein
MLNFFNVELFANASAISVAPASTILQQLTSSSNKVEVGFLKHRKNPLHPADVTRELEPSPILRYANDLLSNNEYPNTVIELSSRSTFSSVSLSSKQIGLHITPENKCHPPLEMLLLQLNSRALIDLLTINELDRIVMQSSLMNG